MLLELLLLERLSDADLAVLGEAAGEHGPRDDLAPRLRRRPAAIPPLLESPEVYAALFEGQREDPLLLVSPFAAFSVVVAHASQMLAGRKYVKERVGPRRAVPVFEVEPLRALVEDPLRRLFLADLLASYTHVASGALWMKGRRGWSHRRFSELDPAQVAELALLSPPHERVSVYRRLGDLALFLTGVFPDYVESHPLPPVAVERIERALAAAASPEPWRLAAPIGLDLGAMSLLEAAGQRAYQLAWTAVPHRALGLAPALGYMTEEFRHARMVLNFVTDGYLIHLRGHWFPLGDG